MDYTQQEILEFINENDVKFIKLMFTDLFGNLKTISIMPKELPRAFETGISFDASGFPGFMYSAESDLFVKPDPSTLAILPWRPQRGRVLRFFCNVYNPDGSSFIGGPRNILQKTALHLKDAGYSVRIGTECEFYLFERDENGEPTLRPHDYAGYCDAAPLDRGENVRREICLTLEEMRIPPESSHHETGPGQHEIDFKYSTLIESADNLATFKNVVKTVAAKNGLFASFLPKPFECTALAGFPGNAISAASASDKPGSGLHVNISLYRDEKNITILRKEESRQFIAGILSHIKEITSFLNPIENSYKRFGAYEAPKYISWSHQNRSELIRIPAAKDQYVRFELRSPDPSCNQYLALALIIEAGLDGIHSKKELQEAVDINLVKQCQKAELDKDVAEKLDVLPTTLEEALAITEKSEFVKRILPEKMVESFVCAKRAQSGDDFKRI